MNRDLNNIRTSYEKYTLEDNSLGNCPFIQLNKWLDQAQTSNILDYNAMVLATIGLDGCPNTRVVLLKEITSNNLIFFTNYNSRKGLELKQLPKASLNFFWPSQERQIILRGSTIKLDKERSKAYFLSRPLDSQLGAWASNQSQPIDSREALQDFFEQTKKNFTTQNMYLPPYWGGYIFTPFSIEFWQGRAGRLHDRIFYTLDSFNQWSWKRLQP